MGKKRNKTKKTQKVTSAPIEVNEAVLSTPDSSSIDETASAEAAEVTVSESSLVDETESDQTPDSSHQTASTSEAETNSVEPNKPQSVFDANQDLPQDELVSAQNLLSTQLATANLEAQSSKTR